MTGSNIVEKVEAYTSTAIRQVLSSSFLFTFLLTYLLLIISVFVPYILLLILFISVNSH